MTDPINEGFQRLRKTNESLVERMRACDSGDYQTMALLSRDYIAFINGPLRKYATENQHDSIMTGVLITQFDMAVLRWVERSEPKLYNRIYRKWLNRFASSKPNGFVHILNDLRKEVAQRIMVA